MRVIGAAILLLVAAACGLMAFGALQNLWADYQDSTTATYLIIGLPLLAFSIALVALAVRLLWRRT